MTPRLRGALVMGGWLWLQAGLSAQALLVVESPTEVPQTFAVSGVALGADRIEVWAYPAGQSPILLGVTVPDRPDALRQLTTGHFTVLVQNVPIGTYPVRVWARDRDDGTWMHAIAEYHVRACQWQAECWTFWTGSTGTIPQFLWMETCR